MSTISSRIYRLYPWCTFSVFRGNFCMPALPHLGPYLSMLDELPSLVLLQSHVHDYSPLPPFYPTSVSHKVEVWTLSLLIKSGIFSENHSWIILAVWAGASSCWNNQSWSFMNDLHISRTCLDNFKFWYELAFILTLSGTKTMLVSPLIEIPAHIITDLGCNAFSTCLNFSGIVLREIE